MYKKKIRHLFTILVFILLSSSFLNAQNKTLDSLKTTAINSRNDLELISVYTQISDIYFNKNKDSALFYIEMAQILADKSGNELQKGKILNLKGDLYRLYNNYEQSVKVNERALEIAVEINDSALMCEVYNDLGVTYRRLDYESEAIKYHLWAIEIAGAIDDKSNLSKSLNSLGIIYFGQERYEDAIKHYQEALQIELESGNLLGQAINYNSIAEVYQKKGLYDLSVEFYNKSIEVNLQNNDSLGVAICHNDVGYNYLLMGDYEQAQDYMLTAYNYFLKSDKLRELSYCQLNIGILAYKTKKYARAIKFLKESEKIASEYNFKSTLYGCYQALSDTYESIGYLSLALNYNKKAFEIYQKMNNDLNSKISAELEAKYQIKTIKNENYILQEKNSIKEKIIYRQRLAGGLITLAIAMLIITLIFTYLSRKKVRLQKLLLEKQNFEILLHNQEISSQKEHINQQNQLLNLQKNELIAANASKDLFFSIIAHDLRNPFNAFLSLSDIMLDSYENLKDEEILEMIGMINESAENAYRLLENLLSWAKSQTGALETKPEIFALNEICEDVMENVKIKSLNKNIKISCYYDKKTMMFADKNMIMTVVRNLLTNAIKFTPQGGKIDVSAIEEKEFVSITVSDNGIGIAPDALKSIFEINNNFKRKGTNNEKGSGLGLILCKDFIEKNLGQISVESTVGEGSSFTFTVPIP